MRDNMQRKEIVTALIRLSNNYHHMQNVSIRALLKETGYLDSFIEIDEFELIEELREHPNFITDWMEYSDDKRTNEGWYFVEDNGEYLVGFINVKLVKSNEVRFGDKVEACAWFIKKEVEEIRKQLRKTQNNGRKRHTTRGK
jgi:hypothetical protein